ncbi:MAG: TetR/AcrR family transcriptional regulator [Xanthobacteraceae bacterium]|nr:TetR/AcrR family transcriptional regulator [Xanthobacteraceae bacterium]
MRENGKRAPGRRSAEESRATRERLLVEAEKQFARHGYVGTSVRDLASALGIAGSSVLHHVGSKRKLYAAVLQRISDSVGAVLKHIDDGEPSGIVRRLAERLMIWSELHPDYVQILLREMMENPVRLNEAHRLQLADFLKEALALTAKAVRTRSRKRVDPDMLLMLVIGAVSYFQIALPTFVAVRGGETRVLKRRFIDTLDELIRSSLEALPDTGE